MHHPASTQGGSIRAYGEQKARGSGWPGPHIYTIYDRTFGDSPAKNIVYTPYIYGSGKTYMWLV